MNLQLILVGLAGVASCTTGLILFYGLRKVPREDRAELHPAMLTVAMRGIGYLIVGLQLLLVAIGAAPESNSFWPVLLLVGMAFIVGSVLYRHASSLYFRIVGNRPGGSHSR